MASLTLPRNRSLSLHDPVIMGIINVTPDSFFTGSRRMDPAEAVATARAMELAGAAMVDVGGESTRPGSEPVSSVQERERVIPVIRAIREQSDICISVDTRKADVARAALEAGADVVNDISGLADCPEIADLAAAEGAPLILMHKKGEPRTMQDRPHYEDVVEEVSQVLRRAIEVAVSRGVTAGQVILDPGIGFGKRFQDNIDLIRAVPTLKQMGCPVLIGLSRKSFLGAICARPGEHPPAPEERLHATTAAHVIALARGADILRVHDVEAATAAVRVWRAFSTETAGVRV